MSLEYEPAVAKYYKQVQKEALEEAHHDNQTSRECYFVCFISRSAGRGRKRREREVGLLVVDGHAFVVKGGEVKSRKKRDSFPQPDSLAKEMLTDLPLDERTSEKLLHRVIEMQKGTRGSGYL